MKVVIFSKAYEEHELSSTFEDYLVASSLEEILNFSAGARTILFIDSKVGPPAFEVNNFISKKKEFSRILLGSVEEVKEHQNNFTGHVITPCAVKDLKESFDDYLLTAKPVEIESDENTELGQPAIEAEQESLSELDLDDSAVETEEENLPDLDFDEGASIDSEEENLPDLEFDESISIEPIEVEPDVELAEELGIEENEKNEENIEINEEPMSDNDKNDDLLNIDLEMHDDDVDDSTSLEFETNVGEVDPLTIDVNDEEEDGISFAVDDLAEESEEPEAVEEVADEGFSLEMDDGEELSLGDGSETLDAAEPEDSGDGGLDLDLDGSDGGLELSGEDDEVESVEMESDEGGLDLDEGSSSMELSLGDDTSAGLPLEEEDSGLDLDDGGTIDISPSEDIESEDDGQSLDDSSEGTAEIAVMDDDSTGEMEIDLDDPVGGIDLAPTDEDGEVIDPTSVREFPDFDDEDDDSSVMDLSVPEDTSSLDLSEATSELDEDELDLSEDDELEDDGDEVPDFTADEEDEDDELDFSGDEDDDELDLSSEMDEDDDLSVDAPIEIPSDLPQDNIPAPEKDGSSTQTVLAVSSAIEEEKSAKVASTPLVTKIIKDKIDYTYDENEMVKLQVTIRHLREEREGILKELEEHKEMKKELTSSNLGLKAELDDTKIELSLLKKRHSEQIEEASYQLRISEDRKKMYEQKLKVVEKEFESLNGQVRVDLNKVKQREKELEAQLELAKMDASAQIQGRDQKILELKRKVDALEFNMENIVIKEQKSKDDRMKMEERVNKIVKTLKGSMQILEDDMDIAIMDTRKSIDDNDGM